MVINKIFFIILAALFIAACDKAPSESNWYDVMPRKSWGNYEHVDTKQDWYEVYKLNKNTYAIYEPNQWQEAISYLLIGSERAMLVDTLQGISDLKFVVDQLTDLPIIVMNTHSHYDHVGSNYQFDTIYGVQNTYTANNAKGRNNKELRGNVTPDTIWKNLPKTFSFQFYDSKPYKIDKFIKNGDIIDLGNRKIEVTYIPGHSPDSIVLVDKKNRLMLTGDSYYPAPITVYSDNSSFQDFFISSQIMFSYRDDVDYLLPGHNETMQPVKFLSELRSATMAVINPTTDFKLIDGNRSYNFGSFKIITKNPLDFGITQGE